MSIFSKTIFRTIIIVLLFSSANFSQSVDIEKLINDTQKIIQTEKHMSLLWWLPNEFWEASFSADPNMSDEMIQSFISVVDDYNVFLIIDADIGPMGGLLHSSEQQILENIKLEIDSVTYSPLSEGDISQDASNFIVMMKPMMANMLGQFGKGMQFVLFEGLGGNGRLLNPKESGSLKLHFNEHTVNWKLPIGSLLPVKYDPETKEEFPGDYNFNPYTGDELIIKE